ncbi:hypothetical protein K3495_g9108 [Podosphaera aphanis]|nr:hypothetical protein K3495_g9108 [Podosphaera aphanis]
MRVLLASIILTILFLSSVNCGTHTKKLARREQYLKLGPVVYQKQYLEKVANFACDLLFEKDPLKKKTYPRSVKSGEKYAIHGPYLEFPLVKMRGQIWQEGWEFSHLLVMNKQCIIVGGKRLTTVVYDTGSVYSQVVGKVLEPTLLEKLTPWRQIS